MLYVQVINHTTQRAIEEHHCTSMEHAERAITKIMDEEFGKNPRYYVEINTKETRKLDITGK